jgi:hypothetical protein
MVQEDIYKVIVTDTGQVLADRVTIADSPVARIRGLLGKTGLENGEGLLITSCSSIHTFFMKFPIDAVFLKKNGTIIKISSNLGPCRLSGCFFGCSMVLELKAGSIRNPGELIGNQLGLVKI